MNISSNISSINAHQTMMNTSGNNIANVNTDGFIPKDTIISNNGDSITPNTRLGDNNGSQKSQTDLSKEIPDQIIAQDAVAVNIAAIRTRGEMLGTLLDMKA